MTTEESLADLWRYVDVGRGRELLPALSNHGYMLASSAMNRCRQTCYMPSAKSVSIGQAASTALRSRSHPLSAVWQVCILRRASLIPPVD